jgi:putative ABC transport system substrate-binding protein
MRKIIAGLLTVSLWLTASLALAQQPKIPRIGLLGAGSADSSPGSNAFRQGLRDLGYIEGKNVVLEVRYAEGKLDRLPSLMAELAQLKLDVIFASSLLPIRAAKEATKTIPIVMLTFGDPVADGFIDSLARPGGNITGLAAQRRDLGGKRLELLQEIISARSQVAILWEATALEAFKVYEASARAVKIQLQSIEVRGPDPDLERAFQAIAKSRANALIFVANPVLLLRRERIASMANKQRLSSMCEQSEYVEAGCLMSYAANAADLYKRAAVYVDKILKGARPADLPVEQPTKFELVINLKTAKQIGLTIPPNVLARADKVIK